MDAKSIEHEAPSLPAESRAKLALALVASLDQLASGEIDARWLDEAGRRAQQLDEGSAELIPGEAVAAQARSLLHR